MNKKNIFAYSDWYIKWEHYLKKYFLEPNASIQKERYLIKIDRLLEKELIPLAKIGVNFDEERESINTVVIHHTAEPTGISLQRLSTLGLLRLYAPFYLQTSYYKNIPIRGLPIWSGHFQYEKMVFYTYHWIIRRDGKQERLLLDREIGWHAGDWSINKQSVGIVLDGNYESIDPTVEQISALADVIRKYYPQIKKTAIRGHNEIYKNTLCPGKTFSNWSQKLYNSLFNI